MLDPTKTMAPNMWGTYVNSEINMYVREIYDECMDAGMYGCKVHHMRMFMCIHVKNT
jgi:hypothetical protein